MWLTATEIVFWVALSLVVYTYAGYPAIVGLVARLRPRRVRTATIAPTVTVLITTFNERARIAARIENCLALDYPADRLKVLVVDDGSVDGTPAIVMRYVDRFPDRVSLVSLRAQGGKAHALNAGMARADTEMVLLADARQRFDRAVARTLVRNLADPSVGAVSGELIIQDPGEGENRSGVGLYWRYEKAIRRAESAFGSSMGFTGAVAMMRRDLYRPLPADTLLDDLVTPLRLVADGYRVVFEPEARATDHVSPTPGHEFRRKVRTLAGVLQTQLELARLVQDPIGPVATWQLVSHKTLRLVVPYALLAVLATSVALPGPWFRMAVAAQVVGYGLGVLGLSRPGLGRARALAAPSTFLLLNWAAVVGAWRYLAGGRLDLWHGGRPASTGAIAGSGPTRSPAARTPLS